MNKNAVLVVVVLLIIAIAAAWYVLWRKPSAVPAAPAASQGIGADIYGKVSSSSNAAATIPETNPYKAVQTNPFAQ